LSVSGNAEQPQDVQSVGFLVHYLNGADLRYFDSAFAEFLDHDNARFVEQTTGVLDPFVLDQIRVRSPRGPAVDLTVIVCPFTSEQALASLRQGGKSAPLNTVRDAMDIAIERGCSVLGFGAYTSIVSGGCADLEEDRIACTSGNSLTVAAAVQAIVDNARELELSRRVLGVVGATGNIGATVCELAAEHASEVILIGRAGATRRLERVAQRLQRPVRISCDMSALRECDMIIGASNSLSPVVLPEHVALTPTVICDLAVPADVHPTVAAARPLARVLKGGLIRLPLEQNLGLGGVEPMPHHVYACLGETLLLGFEGVREHYSYGALQAERVREIQSWARRHEFSVATKLA
jgi:predicted amino acid dehydrogenase